MKTGKRRERKHRKLKCVVKTAPAPGSLALWDKPVPEPGADDILVKVKAAAICGTDVHIRSWNEWSAKRMHPPVTIGHEFCGEVVEVGRNVKGVKAGDIVSAESHLPCNVCPDCRMGNRHVCQHTGLLGITRDGCFAEYISIPADIAYVADSGISYKTLAILEPFGQAVHAVMDYPVAGKTIAVIGCGPIGIMCVMVAKRAGAARIIAVEPNPARGRLALDNGADILVDPIKADPVEMIREITRGVGVDVAIEMSGSVIAEEQATRYIRPEGKFVVAGLPSEPFRFNLAEFAYKGITLHGAAARLMFETWEQVDVLLKQGIDLSGIITHELPLERFSEGIDLMEQGKCGKCLLIPQ
jgi:threonine 3-dehydrogenase